MNAYRRWIRKIGHRRSSAAFMRNFGSRLDRALMRLSAGRVSMVGGSVALLTTTGRRTGLPRETPVIYIRDGEDFIVSCEDFGTSKPSAWPLNLDARPEATLRLEGKTIPCRAKRLEQSAADEYWERLIEAWPAHATYLERSGTRHTFALRPLG